jgi:hypothetical protein
VPPLPADQWDDAVDRAARRHAPQERRNPENASNILGTFVNHPDLTKEFLKFNAHCSSTRRCRRGCASSASCGGTPHRLEVRVGSARQDGPREGLTDDDDRGCAARRAADAFDRTVLAGDDELLDTYELSDATWAALGERFDNDSGWTSCSPSAATSPCQWH